MSAYDFLIWREFEKRELGLAFSYGYWGCILPCPLKTWTNKSFIDFFQTERYTHPHTEVLERPKVGIQALLSSSFSPLGKTITPVEPQFSNNNAKPEELKDTNGLETSLVDPIVRICLPKQGMWVRSLVRTKIPYAMGQLSLNPASTEPKHSEPLCTAT